jgi:hypothetical protein
LPLIRTVPICPPATTCGRSARTTFEADREDLARPEAEAEANEAFNYAVLNADELRARRLLALNDQ